jgi:hypothetical protein
VYRIWLLLTVALLWAILGCDLPASGTQPAPAPAPVPVPSAAAGR